MIFTYAVIMASHIRFRKKNGCPPVGKCQMPGFPYTSWIALISMIIVLLCMPFIPGQRVGLIAGIVMVVFYSGVYVAMKFLTRNQNEFTTEKVQSNKIQPSFVTEFSKELTKEDHEKEENK